MVMLSTYSWGRHEYWAAVDLSSIQHTNKCLSHIVVAHSFHCEHNAASRPICLVAPVQLFDGYRLQMRHKAIEGK